jgi:hypothetical protein
VSDLHEADLKAAAESVRRYNAAQSVNEAASNVVAMKLPAVNRLRAGEMPAYFFAPEIEHGQRRTFFIFSRNELANAAVSC